MHVQNITCIQETTKLSLTVAVEVGTHGELLGQNCLNIIYKHQNNSRSNSLK